MPQFLSGHNKQPACVACVVCHLVAETGSASSHDAFHLSTCCRFFTRITHTAPLDAAAAGICVMVQLDCLEEESISAPL